MICGKRSKIRSREGRWRGRRLRRKMNAERWYTRKSDPHNDDGGKRRERQKSICEASVLVCYMR